MALPPYIPKKTKPVKYYAGRKYRLKTTPEAVQQMRERFWSGEKLPALAKEYGLSHCYTWQICHYFRIK